MASATATPPTPPRSAGWWADPLWLALLAVWSAGWCLSASPRVGTTYDEPFYMDSGMESWRGWTRDDGRPKGWNHESAARSGVMPLPLDAATVPLFVYEVRSGQELKEPDDKMSRLRWARVVTLGWLWLLVFSAWRLGCAAGGPWAGRVAAGLIACDPNFLGHSALATTDVPTAAALTAFAHAVYAGRDGGWWRRVTVPGIWYGVAVLCKLSALLYGGLILVVLEVCFRFASGGLSRPVGGGPGAWARSAGLATARSVLAAATVIVIGIGIACAYFGMPNGARQPFQELANDLGENEPLRPRYQQLAAEYPRVPHAVSAFAFQWWQSSEGRASFLNGTFHPKGVWYFFPVVLAMKVPLPVMLLAAVCLVRPRSLANPLTLAALAMLAVLLKANLQIGFRFGFPVMAIGYVAVAVAVARAYPQCGRWFGGAAVLAVAATSVWVWPHGLCYLNQPSGGLEAAPRQVSDSNLDWGQGVPDLARWHAANGRPRTAIWYFGTDAAARRDPFQVIEIEPMPVTTEAELVKAIRDRCEVLAVGHTVTSLHPHWPPPKIMAIKYLKGRRPLARTATFTLYDFRNGEPPLLE